MTSFNERLEALCETKGTRVCVGLDPDPSRYPQGYGDTPEDTERFLLQLVDATAPHAAAFKPNIAFFEAMGVPGLQVLERVITHIHDRTDAIVILDCKRGDIGNTARAYAKASFGQLQADAVTVAPYMGHDSIEPFATDPAKGVFVLCRTSNPGAQDLQDLIVRRAGPDDDVDPNEAESDDTSDAGPQVREEPLYLATARAIRRWNESGNLGLVAGATYPEDVRRVRETVGDGIPFLMPGIGAQGGDLEAAVQAAADTTGGGFLINAGRSIMYASKGPDHAEASEAAARSLRDAIRAALV